MFRYFECPSNKFLFDGCQLVIDISYTVIFTVGLLIYTTFYSYMTFGYPFIVVECIYVEVDVYVFIDL